MAVDLEHTRIQLAQFVDQSGGGWMTDEAGLTAMVIEMKEAGLIDAEIERDDAGIPLGAIVSCVTQDGHDFLAAAGKPEVWSALLEQCQGSPLKVVTETLGRLTAA
jgi:hypothetical protein